MASIGKVKLAELAPNHPFAQTAIHIGIKRPPARNGKAARITCVWGYLDHRIELTPDQWYVVRCGKKLAVAGPGYAYEGTPFNDAWIFNSGEYELIVLYSNEGKDGVGYNGSLNGVAIEEFVP